MRKFLLLLVFGAQPVAAQDDGTAGEDPPPIVIADLMREDVITVLAAGVEQRVRETGQQVSIFGRDTIEEVQGPDLIRLLQRAPGVTSSRNGPVGSFTGIRVRGAEAEQLLVLVDGVRLADPASPGAGFDFGTLAMGNLAKVELQRSANSTIWGSQAIGGVLSATTLRPTGADASLEYGADAALYATGGAGLQEGPLFLSLRGGLLRGNGFSAVEAGSEDDGYRQSELLGNAGLKLGEDISLFGGGRFADSRAELDGFPAPDFTLADTDEFQETRQLSAHAGAQYMSRPLELRATLSRAETERENFDPAQGSAPTFASQGTSHRAELRGQWHLRRDLALQFGGEREWLAYETTSNAFQKTAISGAYAQLDYDGDPLHLAVGVRRDNHRDFGGQWSFGSDAALDVTENLRATASYGEAFKAPSLFQLHSDYGNAALAPESSRSYDAGLAWAGSDASASLVVFRRDTRDMIGFVSCFGESTGICADRPFGTYDNITRTRAQGMEAEAQAQLTHLITLGLAYAFIESEDRDTGLTLPRRPEHALTLMADWQPREDVSLGADLRVVSDSFDDAANAVRLDRYATLTLRGELWVNDALTLFGRIENAWDEQYQTAAGYATQGRAAYFGVRARF